MPDSTLLSHIILDHSNYKLIYLFYRLSSFVCAVGEFML